MKIRKWIVLLLLMIAAVGCSVASPSPTETPQPTVTETATPTLPPPEQKTTSVPDPEEAVEAYLDAWMAEDYASMYDMLTTVSQDAITEIDFTSWYTNTAVQAALSGVEYDILSSFVQSTRSAQASYRVTLQSVLVGDITRDTVMNLSLEDGEWRVQWADNLIIPELAGGNYFWMDRKIPSRANIYDRNGEAFVTYAEAVSIGVVPGQVDLDQEGKVLTELSWLTGIHPDAIALMYKDYPPGVDWYLALGETLSEKVQQRYDVTYGYDDRGIRMSAPWQARFYLDNGIGSQTIGYVSQIQAAEEEKFLRKGYSSDEVVGRQGIEAWGEPYLGGTRGGTLYVIDSNNNPVTQLADVPAQPSQAIYTTLDKEMQAAAENMLLKYRGAVVAMEIDTGRVLAMASSPGFDPNAFNTLNYNWGFQIDEIYDPYSMQPLLNRASQGQYPLGSVFKIITMAAALESGLFTPEYEYDCGYTFTELQAVTLYDWTWDHYQEDGETLPSGRLTLPEGLMRSCNPFFWHIGHRLYLNGFPEAVADMARGFGLGSPTGIQGVEEEAGNIPNPETELDATNNAIGQGDTLVTPLQVAQFIAAIGNGGTIYQPQLIERIAPPGGEPIYEFVPISKGTLPVSPENLEIIQDAMIAVVENRRGTAQFVLGPYSRNSYAMAGKTGTAESGSGESHAWFAGYTRENRENKPDIAIVVIAENAGEGSEVAAPIFRGMVQQYFDGQRYYLLPWEDDIGVIALPEEETVEE
jgi:penicillin-binding protein 2